MQSLSYRVGPAFVRSSTADFLCAFGSASHLSPTAVDCLDLTRHRNIRKFRWSQEAQGMPAFVGGCCSVIARCTQ